MLRLGNVSATMLVLLLAPAEKQEQMSAHYGACVATWWHARVLSVIITTSSKTFTVTGLQLLQQHDSFTSTYINVMLVPDVKANAQPYRRCTCVSS